MDLPLADWLVESVRYLVAVALAGLSIGLMWAILGAVLAAIGLGADRGLWWHTGLAISLVGGILLIEYVDYRDHDPGQTTESP